MTDIIELEKKIKESGLKKKYIAESLNLSRQGFKNKCDGKNPFTTREVVTLCKLLSITKASEKERIFLLDR